MKRYMSIGNISIKSVLIFILVFIAVSVISLHNAHASGLYETPISADPLQNPVPTITNISPESRHTGDPGFTLNVIGTDFIDGSLIKWDLTTLSTQYITTTQLTAEVPASYLETPGQVPITVENPPPGGGTSNSVMFTILMRANIYLPISIRSWPPQAHTPVLAAIDNTDQDTTYTVNWSNPSSGATYILEEAWNVDFTNAGVAYHGPGLSWMVPTGGKPPGTYYYRVKAINPYNESEWSETQSITIYPLFVGMQARWDGKGYIYILGEYDEPGTHETKHCDVLTDSDTIRCSSSFWYDPNPIGWESESWNSYYSVTTGAFKSSDAIGDPVVKWGYSWKLPYNSWFNNGSTAYIGDKKFTVTGPISGYTTYGKQIIYWEFVNQETFIVQNDGEGLISKVDPGDVLLRYDAGSSALLIYDNVKRHFYYEGEYLGYAQYISNLSATTSLPGSPPVPMLSSSVSTLDQSTILDGSSLEDGLKSILQRSR